MLSSYYLLFMISSVLFLPSFSKEEHIDCEIPAIFELEVDGNKRIFIYDAEISVKYNRSELAVYEYPDTNRVNILINNSAVIFTGHLLQNEDFDPNKLKTSRVLNTKIAGSAQLTKNTQSSDEVTDCRIYVARNRKNDDWDLLRNMQTEILHQAAVCLRAAICKKLGEIKVDDLKNGANNPYDFGQLSVKSERSKEESDIFKSEETFLTEQIMDSSNLTALMASFDEFETNSIDKDELQSTINMVVDIAIAEIIKEMKKEYNGTMRIPDIKQKFFFTPLLNGEFEASDGDFSDITTLSRIGDASLSRANQIFTASCGFGLTRAHIHYEKYKLSYGLKVSGKVSADVKGVAVFVTVAVDYGRRPCQVELRDLQVTKLGKIKIRITGLGPLNGLTSKLVTYITEKWRSEIVGEVEKQVRRAVEDYMNKLDCEKFRP